MPDFDKYSKAECDYGPGSWPEECSTCSHFNGRSACRIVVGSIDPEMWCKFHVYVKGQEHLADEGAESLDKDWCPVCKQYLSTPHRHFTSGEV